MSFVCSTNLLHKFHLHRFYEIICMMTKSLLLLPLKYGREAYFVIRITHADALFCPSLFLWNLIFVPHYADNVVIPKRRLDETGDIFAKLQSKWKNVFINLQDTR